MVSLRAHLVLCLFLKSAKETFWSFHGILVSCVVLLADYIDMTLISPAQNLSNTIQWGIVTIYHGLLNILSKIIYFDSDYLFQLTAPICQLGLRKYI